MKNFHAGERLREALTHIKKSDEHEVRTLDDLAKAIGREVSSLHRMMNEKEFGVARLRLMKKVEELFGINHEYFEKEDAPMLLGENKEKKVNFETTVEKLTDAVETLTDAINKLVDYNAIREKEVNELKKQNRLLRNQKK